MSQRAGCPFYPVLGIGLRFFKTIAFHEALWRMTDHSWGLSTSKLLCSAVRTPSAHRGAARVLRIRFGGRYFQCGLRAKRVPRRSGKKTAKVLQVVM